jgi:hypothetical protein
MVRDPLASELAQLLTDRGLPASARPLPPWPSKTSNVGEVLIVELAGQPRPIALVEWSRVTAYGPPWMNGGRWTVQHSWRDQWVMPMQDIAAGLVDLAQKWSREPEAVGLLDVILLLMDALPPADGGWRAHVLDTEAWIGVERGTLRSSRESSAWSSPGPICRRRGTGRCRRRRCPCSRPTIVPRRGSGGTGARATSPPTMRGAPWSTA